MTKSALLAAAIAVAAPALAQTGATAPAPAPAPAPEPPTPPPAFIAAAQAFGRCVGAKVSAVPVTTTPEVTAQQSLAACATEKTALTAGFEAWVASPTFPEAGRADARTQFAAQMGGLEAQIASRVREARARIPAPAPTATPVAPH